MAAPGAGRSGGGTRRRHDPGARLASAAADRVRPAVGVRRDPAGPAEDGDRPAVAGHPADRGEFTALGAAPRELAGTTWSYHPMQAGASAVWIQVGIGLWLLAAPRGAAVPAGRAGQRRLGPGGLGLRRVVRGDFRPRPDLDVRRPRRSAHLRCRGRADRPAGTDVAQPPARPGHPGRPRPVPDRHGGAAGLARARILAGTRARAAGHPGRDDPGDGADPAAGVPVRLGQRVHRLRRGARVRGQPVRRGGPGRHRCRVPDRAAAAGPSRGHRLHRALRGGLGAGRGLRLLRRPGHRSQQHDPVRAPRRSAATSRSRPGR